MAARPTRRALLCGGAAVALAGCAREDSTPSQPSPAPAPTPADPAPSAPTQPSPTASSSEPSPSQSLPPVNPQVTATIADNIPVPWGFAFLPAGFVNGPGSPHALVGSRDTGDLYLVSAEGAEIVGHLDVRTRVDEGGLLGLALHPEFASNGRVYAYISTEDDNRIVWMRFDGHALSEPTPVLTGIATAGNHNGGGLAFGPDGHLYASTGDAGERERSRDTGVWEGKVLRMTDEGRTPPGNPFGNLVWSYGHRNVEGLCFDDSGRLWASEFGDKGADELNLIKAGADYGWPDVEGSDGKGGYADPLAQWPVEDCSPSGVAIAGGRAWLGALRGRCVWSVILDGPERGQTERHFFEEYGRIRSVVAAPDGGLWIATSNRDGRGDPQPEDDRILQVTL